MASENERAHGRTPVSDGAAMWLWLSIVAVVLAVVGNLVGLSVQRIYAGLTPAFKPQALAQDVANLILVVPLWLIVVWLALRGSLRAYLMWLGVLTFTVYNYVIYTFAIPFGPLFLLWVAVLGLALFALLGGFMTVDAHAVAASFQSRRAVLTVGWFLIVTGALFSWLWLSDDVPALLSGTVPTSLTEIALPTNPVHILDLAFFLPLVIATGVLLIRGRPLAYVLAVPLIVFLILTGVPVLLTPVVQTVRGATATWGVVRPIGTLTVALVGLLGWLLATVTPPATVPPATKPGAST